MSLVRHRFGSVVWDLAEERVRLATGADLIMIAGGGQLRLGLRGRVALAELAHLELPRHCNAVELLLRRWRLSLALEWAGVHGLGWIRVRREG